MLITLKRGSNLAGPTYFYSAYRLVGFFIKLAFYIAQSQALSSPNLGKEKVYFQTDLEKFW